MKTSHFYSLYQRHRQEVLEVVRYLLVGGWNTLFGIGLFAVMFWCLQDWLHYQVIVVTAWALSVVNAYACYKIFVFRTRGNIWRELSRCYVVYTAALAAQMTGMWILVDGCGLHPIVANALVTFIVVVISYLGHKLFSFKK